MSNIDPRAQNVTASLSREYLLEYNGDSLLAITILVIVLVSTCVVLRFYARRLGRVKWGVDDTLIIPGTVFCLAVCTCALTQLQVGGVGYHQAFVAATAPDDLPRRAKFLLVTPLMYLAAVLFPKLAILAIYLRIFISRPYRVACWVLGAFLIINWFTFTVAAFFMCSPLEYLWNKRIIGGRCFDINLFYRLSAFPNIATDVIMLVLPLPVVWKLQTSQNVKIGLTITFATGSIGLLTSILRAAGFFYHSPVVDTTHSAVYLLIYVVCECGMYLIAACLPTYKPLAVLFHGNGVLNISCIGSRRKTHGHTTRSDTSNTQLRTFQDRGFELLEEDPSRSVKSQTGQLTV